MKTSTVVNGGTDYGKEKEGPYGCFNIYSNKLQWLNSAGCLTVFLTIFCSIYAFSMNGALTAAITTIERRFGITSQTAGIIISANDIGFLIVALPFEALTRDRNRGRVLGLCCLILSLSTLMFVIPHLATEAVVPGSSNSTIDLLCTTSVRDFNQSTSNLKSWSILFIAAGMMVGCAMVPIRTIGHACVEDEAELKNGGFNMAMISLGLVIGPLVGNYITSLCLGSLWCDITANVDLDPTDENWLGAWWLPFMIIGLLGFIISPFVFGYPNQFPGAHKIKRDRDTKITFGKIQSKYKQNPVTFSRLDDYKEILTNPIWVINTIGKTFDNIFQLTIISFGIKFIKVQFYVSASYAAFIGTLCFLATMITGIAVSILLRACQPSPSTNMFVSSLSSVIAVALYIPCNIYFPCENQTIQGVFDEQGVIIDPPIFQDTCNIACNCDRNIFFPVCDISTNITYLTPCDAGCNTMFNGSFEDCSCSESSQLVQGRCDNNCTNLGTYVGVIALVFAMAGVPIPLTQPAVMQYIAPRLKSFQMGLSLLIIRGIAGVAVPIFLGSLIDGTCAVWQTNQNGENGACFVNDHTQLSDVFLYLPGAAKAASSICYFVAGIIMRRKGSKTVSKL